MSSIKEREQKEREVRSRQIKAKIAMDKRDKLNEVLERDERRLASEAQTTRINELNAQSQKQWEEEHEFLKIGSELVTHPIDTLGKGVSNISSGIGKGVNFVGDGLGSALKLVNPLNYWGGRKSIKNRRNQKRNSKKTNLRRKSRK